MVWKLLLSALCLSQSVLSNPVPTEPRGLQLLNKRSFLGYEKDLVKGVNLGGWFVLEPYITPSLFEAFGDDIPVDEYHYCEYLGKDEAQSRLEDHWSTWYNESDFAKIASRGMNLVRIPIGYWAFVLKDDDPYVQGQVDYLDQAIEWARAYDLKVWIDLHGAAGSQNGFDNSGIRDQIEFQQDNNVNVTLTALQAIFDKYGGKEYLDVIVGIELLNEPLGSSLDMDQLNLFWKWAYENLRSTGSVQNVIIQDAFTQSGYFNDKFLLDDYWGVVIDHHHYQVFSTGELNRTIDEHVEVACQWGKDAAKEWHWNLCGEWSAALTDCSYWLNGVGRGARWDGTYQSSTYFGSCENVQSFDMLTDTEKENYRKYIEAQLDAFQIKGGWIFWCWKTESSLEWDMQRLFDVGLFPYPLNERLYPGQCTNK